MSSSGKLYVLDGPDGCGKSTQARLLVESLRAEGRTVHHLREPGATALGERIRSLLLDRREGESDELAPSTEVLLFFASRVQMIESLVRPALAAGETVVCERFVSSTFAYQGCASEAGAELVLDLAQRVLGGAFPPDRTILLDLDAATSLARATGGAHQGDRIESRGLAYHEQVRRGFLRYAELFAESTTVLEVGELSPAEVAQRVRESLAAVESAS